MDELLLQAIATHKKTSFSTTFATSNPSSSWMTIKSKLTICITTQIPTFWIIIHSVTEPKVFTTPAGTPISAGMPAKRPHKSPVKLSGPMGSDWPKNLVSLRVFYLNDNQVSVRPEPTNKPGVSSIGTSNLRSKIDSSGKKTTEYAKTCVSWTKCIEGKSMH